MIRCSFVNNNPLYIKYHDEEWCVPSYDDNYLFEMLVLESFQAGLSWECILNKRENFRKAFDNFNYKKISLYDENKINELLNDPGIIRNTGKCILCGRCIETCKELQGIGILGFEKRGFNTFVAPAENRSFAKSPCMQCGQCVLVCPTGALMEHDEIHLVDEAKRQGKFIVCQVAPAVRSAIAEEFGALT